jgi:hypothetical protein
MFAHSQRAAVGNLIKSSKNVQIVQSFSADLPLNRRARRTDTG